MEGRAEGKIGKVDEQNRVTISIRMPKSLRRRVRLFAVENETTVMQVVTQALTEALGRVRKREAGKKKAKVYVLRRHTERRQ